MPPLPPSPPERERLAALRPVLEQRAAVVRAVRRFFEERDFLEVETPVRLPAPPPEIHIDAEPSGAFFLRTSPELHMKRLLAAGYGRIFQIGPSFRRGERGALHHPEYSMLEWYRAGADYNDILRDTQDLLRFVAREVLASQEIVRNGLRIRLDATWIDWTVSEAFLRFAGWDPAETYNPDRFDRDLVERVEPSLPRETPVILRDYPAPAAALARRKPGRETVAERWELYIAGIELANAYSELTDPAEQGRRFEEWIRGRRTLGKPEYPADREFLDALRAGLPPAGGIALGMDRLILLFTGRETIGDITAFQEAEPVSGPQPAGL